MQEHVDYIICPVVIVSARERMQKLTRDFVMRGGLVCEDAYRLRDYFFSAAQNPSDNRLLIG